MKCVGGCGRTLDGLAPDQYWVEVSGWDRKRSAGGSNQIALRKVGNRGMCNDCMRKEKAGLSTGQQALA